MTNKPDFYEVLGVAKTATQPELDKAFQSIAMKCHPDMLRMKTPEQKAKLLESFLSKAPSARGNVKTLEEFFILSVLTIKRTDAAEPSALVLESPHQKCARCWKHIPAVGHQPHADLCDRCDEAVA